MAKTYSSIPTVATGDVYTATAHNNIAENVNNYRVPPMCRVKRSGNLSYTSNTDIAWTAEDFDTVATHDNPTNNTRITINTAGVYVVSFGYQINFSGTWTGGDSVIKKNGGTTVANTHTQTRSVNVILSINTVVEAAVGDYFTAAVVIGGATSPIVAEAATTYFCAAWLGQVS